jgi:hypothetical protein
MKRPARPQRPPRANASRRRARPAVVDAPAIEPAAGSEQPGVDQAGPIGAIDNPRGTQTSIERVDERRLGSIEAVPAVPEVITGFVEPAGDERADGALPPAVSAP